MEEKSEESFWRIEQKHKEIKHGKNERENYRKRTGEKGILNKRKSPISQKKRTSVSKLNRPIEYQTEKRKLDFTPNHYTVTFRIMEMKRTICMCLERDRETQNQNQVTCKGIEIRTVLDF